MKRVTLSYIKNDKHELTKTRFLTSCKTVSYIFHIRV